MSKTIINHHIFDGFYHSFMVILGMVYYCLTTLNRSPGKIVFVAQASASLKGTGSWLFLQSARVAETGREGRIVSPVAGSGPFTTKYRRPSFDRGPFFQKFAFRMCKKSLLHYMVEGRLG